MGQVRAICAAAILFTAAYLPPVVVLAQIEEVVVTAQKREQLAQDIGVSVSTFDRESLRELRATDAFGVGNQIPNVQVYTSANLPSFTVRGIGLNEFAANFDAPVAIHIDEVYMSKPFMVSVPFFDIERVEALKGPQGTLFGRNTTGGAINYYTAQPTDSLETGVEIGLDHHGRYNAEGYLSGPLTEHVAGRLSAYVGQGSGGPFTNRFDGDELKEWDQLLYRGKLAWDYDTFTVRLKLHGGTDDSTLTPYNGPGIFNIGAPGVCPEVLAGEVSGNLDACSRFNGLIGDPDTEFEIDDPFVVNQDHFPVANNTMFGGSLRMDLDLSWGTLTALAGYESFERDQREDSDGSNINSANTDWYTDIEQVTLELRAAGGAERWRYVAGLYFERDDLTEIDSSNLGGNPLGIVPPVAPRLAASFVQEVDSIAAFFHNEFDLTDRLRLIAGLRHTSDTTSLDGSTFLGADDPQGIEDRITPVIAVDARVEERNDDNLSYKVGLDWAATDDVLFYGNVTTGFRSGGFSVPFGGVITSFSPEEMLATEIGIKSRIFQDSVQLNSAVFRYDYDDLQVNVDDPRSPLVPITHNIGKSETAGFEADLWWSPNERWDVRAGLGYLDAEFRETDRAITTYAGVVPLEGKRPVNTPEWTYNGLVRYERPVGTHLRLVLMSNFRWTDERFLEATNQPFDRADDYLLVDARAAIGAADGRWEVAAWGQNITDEEYLTYINNISFFKLNSYGDPATYGISFSYRYE